MSYQLLPYGRTAQLLTDLFGSAPSEGTLHQAQQSAAIELTEVEEAIKEGLRQAEVAHFDETSVYIAGKRQERGLYPQADVVPLAPQARRGRHASNGCVAGLWGGGLNWAKPKNP